MIPAGPLDGLAERLAIPARCGVYITKSEMVVLARLTDGSLRVNERRRMLADVLKSPDSLVDLSRTLDRLLTLCEAHIERYDDLRDAFPSLEAQLRPWRSRCERTVIGLREVQDELAG